MNFNSQQHIARQGHALLNDAALSSIPSPPGLRLLMEVRGPTNPHEIIGADGGHAEFGTAGGRKVGDSD